MSEQEKKRQRIYDLLNTEAKPSQKKKKNFEIIRVSLSYLPNPSARAGYDRRSIF